MLKRFLRQIGLLALIICGSHVLPKANMNSVHAMEVREGTYHIRCDTRNEGHQYLTGKPQYDKCCPMKEATNNRLYADWDEQIWKLKKIHGEGWKISFQYTSIGHYYSGKELFLEAFPNSDIIRPRRESYDQDQTWYIQPVTGSHEIKLYCNTRNGGKRYLEAFPREGAVRPRPGSTHSDQYWELLPIH